MNRKSKYFCCKRLRLLTYLLSNGYVYIKTDKDRNDKKRNVWIFKNTPELMNCVEQFNKNNKGKRGES